MWERIRPADRTLRHWQVGSLVVLLVLWHLLSRNEKTAFFIGEPVQVVDPPVVAAQDGLVMEGVAGPADGAFVTAPQLELAHRTLAFVTPAGLSRGPRKSFRGLAFRCSGTAVGAAD